MPFLRGKVGGWRVLTGVERLFGEMNIPARNQKGKHLFGKFLDSERPFDKHMFMTTNARSTTSPVSTLANQFPSVTTPRFGPLSNVMERSAALDWWERPPASPGSVHVSLRADRSSDSISSSRPTRLALKAEQPAKSIAIGRFDVRSETRTGAPAIQPRQRKLRREVSPRSRLGVFAGILLAVFVGGFGIANASSSSKDDVRIYVVRPGDSFWSIARSVQSQGDLRPLVADLIEAHGSSSLQVGDRVELAAR